MTKAQGWVLIVGMLVLIALTAVCLVSVVRNPWEPILNLPGQAATTVSEIIHPTPTIYPDPVVVIQQVRSLAKLETVQYSIDQVITAESGQGFFSFLFGDRLLLVAHGRVVAGIDLSKVLTADIRVDTFSGTVSMILPPAEIFSVALDNEKTAVYSRESGWFPPSAKTLETDARKMAEKQIRAAAVADGILDTAMTNGQAFLQRFILALGYRQVVFLVASPTPGGSPVQTPAPMVTATP
jgi:hypothetical protein